MGRYEMTQQGDRTCFAVHPAGTKIPLGCGFVFFLMVFLLVGFLNAMAGSRLLESARPSANRKSTSFEVTPSGIRIFGGVIARERIHGLVPRNRLFGDLVTVVVSTSLVDMILFGIARAYRNKVARVSWRLDVDAQGQAYTLAGGLDDTTLGGLKTDVERALFRGTSPIAAPPSSLGGFCTNGGWPRGAGARFCANCGGQHAP